MTTASLSVVRSTNIATIASLILADRAGTTAQSADGLPVVFVNPAEVHATLSFDLATDTGRRMFNETLEYALTFTAGERPGYTPMDEMSELAIHHNMASLCVAMMDVLHAEALEDNAAR